MSASAYAWVNAVIFLDSSVSSVCNSPIRAFVHASAVSNELFKLLKSVVNFDISVSLLFISSIAWFILVVNAFIWFCNSVSASAYAWVNAVIFLDSSVSSVCNSPIRAFVHASAVSNELFKLLKSVVNFDISVSLLFISSIAWFIFVVKPSIWFCKSSSAFAYAVFKSAMSFARPSSTPCNSDFNNASASL